jgi:hypothetical protein
MKRKAKEREKKAALFPRSPFPPLPLPRSFLLPFFCYYYIASPSPFVLEGGTGCIEQVKHSHTYIEREAGIGSLLQGHARKIDET